MHLLVLSAFRPGKRAVEVPVLSLNAPFGAQCFPTWRAGVVAGGGLSRLNAPFGAQCFPTRGSPRL